MLLIKHPLFSSQNAVSGLGFGFTLKASREMRPERQVAAAGLTLVSAEPRTDGRVGWFSIQPIEGEEERRHPVADGVEFRRRSTGRGSEFEVLGCDVEWWLAVKREGRAREADQKPHWRVFKADANGAEVSVEIMGDLHFSRTILPASEVPGRRLTGRILDAQGRVVARSGAFEVLDSGARHQAAGGRR